MLSTLLTSLASYFSKYFIVASFLPIVAFTFFNVLTGFVFIEPFRDWSYRTLFADPSAGHTAFLTAAITVAALGASYVLSSLIDYLRGLLEGKWPEPIRRVMLGGHMRRFQDLLQRIERANRVRQDLEDGGPAWTARLTTARHKGAMLGSNTFSKESDDGKRVFSVIEKLHRKQSRQVLIDSADISKAVDGLERSLQAHNAEDRERPDLDRAHQELVLIIRSAGERAKNEHLRVHNHLSSTFGTQDIAPTAMGNIANAAQAYAVRRYDCNLELFWNDLQRVIQKDESAYAVLQTSKAQLDFLVACCWLTTAYWVTWLAVSAVWGYSVALFGALAIVGPFLSYFWYRAATENYRSFVDVLTTTLDLFRLELLRALSVSLPADVDDERRLWDSLHRLSSFEGDTVNLRYQHPKPSN